MNRTLKVLLGTISILLFFEPAGYGEIRLPRLVSDGMILQRETTVKIWGWSDSGEKISLQFNNQSFETVSSPDGKWQIILPAQKAGGPFEMIFIGSNRIILKDVLFGDVWICSGQSNMEYPMSRLTDKYYKDISSCENSQIRQFKVPQVYNFNAPSEDYPSGSWISVSPETILNFSAVAYFFARDLYEKYQIPVGIINASVGGSPAEAWMSIDALKEFPFYIEEAEKFKDQSYIDEIQVREKNAVSDWYTTLNRTDKGLQSQPAWKDPRFAASLWPSMPVPSFWAEHGLAEINGVVWFRKEIEVSASMIGKPAILYIGRIVDFDSVFINGIFAGTTSYQYPQRRYPLPGGLLQSGKNTIVVRVISNSGRGGFIKDKPYKLIAGSDTLHLEGDWQYQLGCEMSTIPGQTFVQWKPTGLYNGMLAPANNYTIKGVAWYQGESNAERYQEYQKLLTSLITDWRLKHEQGNFPFIIVQLPNFMSTKDQPSESSWASLRNAQLKTSLSVDNSVLTVNIDLGEWNDIHPQNKAEIGRRLAMAAEQLAYSDKNTLSSGPVYQSARVKGNKVEITFTSCGKGLMSKDGQSLKQFAIAGPDHRFVWAKAEIRGNKVIVYSDEVLLPEVVRYAWADNPKGANLQNREGLPASPFTTEN